MIPTTNEVVTDEQTNKLKNEQNKQSKQTNKRTKEHSKRKNKQNNDGKSSLEGTNARIHKRTEK